MKACLKFCVITGTAFWRMKVNEMESDLIWFMWRFLWAIFWVVLTGPSNTFFRYDHFNTNIILNAGSRDSLFIMAILFKTCLYRFIWVCASPKYYLYKRVTSKALRVHPCINLVSECRLFLMLLLNDLSWISAMIISLK